MPKSTHATGGGADRADLRYLGRLLGDVIRQSDGAAVYERIETIRQASVEVHRAPGAPAEAALALALEALDLGDSLRFIRGFLLFSRLANLAEDRDVARDTRADATLAGAVAALAAAGIDSAAVSALLDRALIAPVLTAHPTEVRRKSMIDREAAIEALLAARTAPAADLPDIETQLRREIGILWQTQPLRAVRPVVADEIDTALSYFGRSFIPELPRLHARWEKLLGAPLPPFLRPGSWIGGDRDGNPNVNAATLDAALAKQAAVALGHYLDELNALGAELSLSAALAPVSPALAALADASGDAAASRADEPYRRALTGIYARTAATYAALAGRAPTRAASVAGAPYARADERGADLRVVADSL
ncbi:MAG: phosphoenolpyruvate carboxylase, partial [Polymorphobacter sp.]